MKYRDGKPIFEQDGYWDARLEPGWVTRGDSVILSFGSFFEYGEGYWPVVIFEFDLSSGDSGWFVEPSHKSFREDLISSDELSKYMAHEPEVLELREKINTALQNQEGYTFLLCDSPWALMGSDFSLHLAPNQGYLVKNDEEERDLIQDANIIPSKVHTLRDPIRFKENKVRLSAIQRNEQPKSRYVYAWNKNCLFIIIVSVLLGLMLMDPSSILYTKFLAEYPIFTFIVIFILVAITGVTKYQ
jgi:hypothetical protein